MDKRGLVRQAPDPLLVKYELLISEAIHGVQRQISGSETKLFEDVDGVYQKLMAASWSVESVSGFLVGQVILFLTEPLRKDEAESAAKKIETLNSSSFPIRLKNWSVFTDEGLLFAYMRDEDGDYGCMILKARMTTKISPVCALSARHGCNPRRSHDRPGADTKGNRGGSVELSP